MNYYDKLRAYLRFLRKTFFLYPQNGYLLEYSFPQIFAEYAEFFHKNDHLRAYLRFLRETVFFTRKIMVDLPEYSFLQISAEYAEFYYKNHKLRAYPRFLREIFSLSLKKHICWNRVPADFP